MLDNDWERDGNIILIKAQIIILKILDTSVNESLIKYSVEGIES